MGPVCCPIYEGLRLDEELRWKLETDSATPEMALSPADTTDSWWNQQQRHLLQTMHPRPQLLLLPFLLSASMVLSSREIDRLRDAHQDPKWSR